MSIEKEESEMNACAIKPKFPYVAKNILPRTLVSEENKKITEFINSHDFSFSVDKNTGELKSTIIDKKL